MPRIVSFLPAGTEMVHALGAAADLTSAITRRRCLLFLL
jgi:hypothetical protein